MDREQIDAHVQKLLEEEKPDPAKAIAVLPVPQNGEEEEVIEGIVTAELISSRIPLLRRRIPLAGVVVSVVLAFLITFLCVFFAVPLFFETATVAISPLQKSLTKATQITIQGHTLAPLSLSLSQQAPTTGKGHQNAANANGLITFYNAAPYAQSIDAGTLLVAGDGTQIVTSETLVIPAGNPPIEGQASVSAHAIISGTEGNIAAFAMDGSCCKENIFVKNLTAFTGGMDARDFQAVAQSDIETTVANIEPELMKNVTHQASKLLSSDDILLSPIPCKIKITANHKAGDAASQVQVEVSEYCTPVSYNKETLHNQVKAAMQRVVTMQFGANYTLVEAIPSTISKTILLGSTINLTLICKAIVFSTFNQTQKDVLVKRIAGKSREEAMMTISRSEGVGQVGVTISPSYAQYLPSNPSSIHVAVSYPSMSANMAS